MPTVCNNFVEIKTGVRRELN